MKTGAGAASEAKASLDVNLSVERDAMLLPARMRFNQAAGAMGIKVTLPYWS